MDKGDGLQPHHVLQRRCRSGHAAQEAPAAGRSSGHQAYVIPVEKAVAAYKNPKYAPFKTLFLFTNPRDVVRAVKGGIPFKSVNLGGMTYKDGDTLISQAVAVNKDDAQAIKELVDMGIEVEIRKLANEPKKDAIEALKAKGLL